MADMVERPEDLYGVDLSDFVSERNALAARLKASGDIDASVAVKALRKPTRSAWALNLLAREQPERIEQVLDAARGVVAAINDGGDQLRGAQAEYSRGVAVAVEAAADRYGITGEGLERMRSTVLAAGGDPGGDVAAALRAGTLADDAAAPGFSFAGVVAANVTSRPTATVSAAPASDCTEADATGTERTAESAAVEAAARAADRRRARERERLQQQVERSEQRVGRLSDVAEAADAAAVEARAHLSRAQDELQDMQRRLEEMDRPTR